MTQEMEPPILCLPRFDEQGVEKVREFSKEKLEIRERKALAHLWQRHSFFLEPSPYLIEKQVPQHVA